MDVIIPSHNIKTFASSITTLSKIGKILYLEFDPLDGLSIRTLNDAKSCFVYFHFEVGFFERCSSSLDSWKTQTLKNKKNKNRNRRGESGESGRSRVVSNSRRRRRIRRRTTSLNRNSTTNSSRNGGNKRNRSQSAQRRDKDNEGNNNNKDKDDKMSEEEETNHHSDSDNSNDNNNNNDNNENNESDNDDDNDEKYLCKVPIKTVATILRSRKGLLSLRIRSVTSSSSSSSNKHNQHHRDDVDNDYNMDIENDNDDDDDDEIGSQMQLSFEYQIQSNGIMHITHKVNLSNADGIIALAPKQHCSEIITIPQVLLTMLDQVKSTSEVALTVNDDLKKVVASSFHYGFYNNASSNENGGGGSSSNGNGNGNDNLMMNMATAAILKTETSVDCNDFEDFHYMDDFAVERVMAEEEKETLTAVDGADATGGGPDIPPPATIAKEVTLVFSIKEAKAMLQFCASSNSNSNYMDGEEANVIVSFYWGGRPVIIETEGEAFRGELILATVDHSLLNGITNRYTSSSSTTKTNHSSSGAREAEGAARRRSR